MQSNTNLMEGVLKNLSDAVATVKPPSVATLQQVSSLNEAIVSVTAEITKSVKNFASIKRTLKEELAKKGEEEKLEEIYFQRVIEPINTILKSLNQMDFLKNGNYYCHAMTVILADESPVPRASERGALRNGFKKFIIDSIWNENLFQDLTNQITFNANEEISQVLTKLTQNLSNLKSQSGELINLECLKVIECPNGVVAFAEYKRLKAKGESVDGILTDQSMTTSLLSNGGVARYDEQGNKQLVIPETEIKGEGVNASMAGIITLKSGETYYNSLNSNKESGIKFTLNDLKGSPQEISENAFYIDGIPFILALRTAGEECPIIFSTGDLKDKGGLDGLFANYYPNLTEQELQKLKKNLIIFGDKEISGKKIETLLFSDPVRVDYFKNIFLRTSPKNDQIETAASFHELATPRPPATPLPETPTPVTPTILIPSSPYSSSPIYTPQSTYPMHSLRNHFSLPRENLTSASTMTPGSEINTPELVSNRIKTLIVDTYKLLIQNDKDNIGYDNILNKLLLEKNFTQDFYGLGCVLRFLFYLEKFLKEKTSLDTYSYNTSELFKNIIFLLGPGFQNNIASLNTLLYTTSPANWRYRLDFINNVNEQSPENLGALLAEFDPEYRERSLTFSFLFNLETLNIFIKLGASLSYISVEKFPRTLTICGKSIIYKEPDGYPFFYDLIENPFFWKPENFNIIEMLLKENYIKQEVKNHAIINTILGLKFSDYSPEQIGQLFNLFEKLLAYNFKLVLPEKTQSKLLNSGNVVLALAEKLKKSKPNQPTSRKKETTQFSPQKQINFHDDLYADSFFEAGKRFLDLTLERNLSLITEKNKSEQSPFKVAYHSGGNFQMMLYLLNKMNSQDPDLGIIEENSKYKRSDREITSRSNEAHYNKLQERYRRDCWRVIHCAIRLRMDPGNDGKAITSDMVKANLQDYIDTFVKDRASPPSEKIINKPSSPEIKTFSSGFPSLPGVSKNLNFQQMFFQSSPQDSQNNLFIQFNKDLEVAAKLEDVNLNEIDKEAAFNSWQKTNHTIQMLYLFPKEVNKQPVSSTNPGGFSQLFISPAIKIEEGSKIREGGNTGAITNVGSIFSKPKESKEEEKTVGKLKRILEPSEDEEDQDIESKKRKKEDPKGGNKRA